MKLLLDELDTSKMPEEMQVFAIDNVARYFFEVSDREVWKLSDFPNCTPPFSIFWMEWAAPTKVNAKGTIVQHNELSGVRVGISARAYTRDEFLANKGFDPVKKELIPSEFWFAIMIVPSIKFPGGWFPPFGYLVFVDSAGRLIDTHEVPLLALSRSYPVNPLNWFTGIMGPVFMALGFLHCRNVAVVDGEAPSSRRAKRRSTRISYKILNIEPMRRVLRREGQAHKTGIKKALHICRGHFANYEDKPLFGKYTGTFWVPAHTRGHLDNGAVVKTYSV